MIFHDCTTKQKYIDSIWNNDGSEAPASSLWVTTPWAELSVPAQTS